MVPAFGVFQQNSSGIEAAKASFKFFLNNLSDFYRSVSSFIGTADLLIRDSNNSVYSNAS
jgi:hypothetical protein